MNPSSSKRNVALAAMVLLLAGGFTRLLIVVSHRPMFGFANNYDFIKISSTVGLWVDEPGVDIHESHPSAPLRHFRSHAAPELERRYLSSELLAVFAAISVGDIWNRIIANPPHSFDLRILGITKAVMFLAVGTGLSSLFFKRSPAIGVVSAMIFAVLICDPINSLYFNTLYFEDAALLFSYAAVGLGVYLVLMGRSRVGLLAALCISLFLAAFSKMPHAGLALAIALAFGIARLGALRSQSKRCAGREFAAVLFIGLLSLWLGIVHNRSPSLRSMVFAAATDSWFGMALPALKNPSATLRSLKLPPACDELVGQNWYTPGMHPHRCPEVLGLTRLQMIAELLQQPKALARILITAIPLTRPFSPYYGQGEECGGSICQPGSSLRAAAASYLRSSVPAVHGGRFNGCLLVACRGTGRVPEPHAIPYSGLDLVIPRCVAGGWVRRLGSAFPYRAERPSPCRTLFLCRIGSRSAATAWCNRSCACKTNRPNQRGPDESSRFSLIPEAQVI